MLGGLGFGLGKVSTAPGWVGSGLGWAGQGVVRLLPNRWRLADLHAGHAALRGTQPTDWLAAPCPPNRLALQASGHRQL